MTITIPDGNIYGGVAPVAVRDAHNYTYVVYCGERKGYKFGTHIFRVDIKGKIEWIDYSPFTESRVETIIEPDGLYIVYPVNREREIIRIKIPGFVTPSYPGGTNYPPPSPVIISSTDNAARDQIAAVSKALQDDIKNLKAQVRGLQKEIEAVKNKPNQLTEQEIKDRIWSISADRFYAELSNPNSPVSNLIREIATGKR